MHHENRSTPDSRMPPDIGRPVSPPRLEYGSRDQNPPLIRQTHPRELIIHPHEVDFRLPPYEPRPLAQHLIIPVSGKFIFTCNYEFNHVNCYINFARILL